MHISMRYIYEVLKNFVRYCIHLCLCNFNAYKKPAMNSLLFYVLPIFREKSHSNSTYEPVIMDISAFNTSTLNELTDAPQHLNKLTSHFRLYSDLLTSTFLFAKSASNIQKLSFYSHPSYEIKEFALNYMHFSDYAARCLILLYRL